jgi:hypothetical protein
MDKKKIFRDFAFGALGGIAGTFAMERVSSWVYEYESQEKKKLEESLRKEEPPMVMARKLTEEVLHTPVSEGNRKRLGMAIHWGYGAVWGGIYGVLHNRAPFFAKAAGLPFAIAFTLIGDEFMNTAMGLTPPPQAFPKEAHIRGAVAHYAYTAAADGVYRVLDKVSA